MEINVKIWANLSQTGAYILHMTWMCVPTAGPTAGLIWGLIRWTLVDAGINEREYRWNERVQCWWYSSADWRFRVSCNMNGFALCCQPWRFRCAGIENTPDVSLAASRTAGQARGEHSCSQQLIVFFVGADPESNDPSRGFNPNWTIVKANSYRPKPIHFLKMQRGVAGVIFE